VKAAQFDRFGPADVLFVGEVPLPAIDAGGVLIEVAAASVNPKDTFIRKGRFRRFTGARFPMVTGADCAGTVVKLGPAATGLALGERVWGMIEGFRGGACAQYVALPAAACGAMPPSLSFEEAGAIPLAGQTALQALRDHGRLRAGQRLCINGASGGVGVFAIQIARSLGAHVTALCSARSARSCRDLGADSVVDYAVTPLPALADRFDLIFDVFGNASFLRAWQRLLPRGRYVSTVPSRANALCHALTCWWPGRQGRLVIVRSRRRDLDFLAALVEQGRLRPVVDRVYAFSEIAVAHRHVETKHTQGKVVVRVKPGSDLASERELGVADEP